MLANFLGKERGIRSRLVGAASLTSRQTSIISPLSFRIPSNPVGGKYFGTVPNGSETQTAALSAFKNLA